jgi:hypothetical protein
MKLIKFHENPLSGFRVVVCKGADMAGIMGAFWNSTEDGPKLYERLTNLCNKIKKCTLILMFYYYYYVIIKLL